MAVYLKGINDDKGKCILHSIPCKIHADDVANVSLYFKPSDNGNDHLTSSFRGYPLDGKVVKVPENYGGYVFKELQNDDIEGEERNLILSSRFDSLTYWNWNKLPTKSDPFISALDWVDVSQVIHDPIEDD
ncbi:hypothetical protein O3M35_005288 [Rhynocoris fuscipes]|uniref:Uncharacterized protein n=1 Tax=Rhynocoris fuscipes TaxID=488301 RepID=A0AAW1DI63_9HEMI